MRRRQLRRTARVTAEGGGAHPSLRARSKGMAHERGTWSFGRFNEFMQKLLQEKARDLYRCKGVVAFAGSEDKYVFHGVHEQVSFAPTEEGWAPGQKKVHSPTIAHSPHCGLPMIAPPPSRRVFLMVV